VREPNPLKVLLLATYELGRPPFGLAESAAWLRADVPRDKRDVVLLDLSLDPLDEAAVRAAHLVAFHLPMHTATRLAARLIPRVRAMNPAAHLAAFGLYAPKNEPYLRRLGVGTVLGGEFEAGLLSLVERLERDGGAPPPGLDDQREPRISTARQRFLVPDRSDLPPLDRYARLVLPDGTERLAGYVEASRGCKHRCRHCPVVPVYEGRFRVVPIDVVLADVAQQVAAGARHVTFGDPDFLNGPRHGLAIVRALHGAFPDLTYDVTIKISHLLDAAASLPLLRETGCLFVTTAVESVDDAVLDRLRKGHTRADFHRAVALCDGAGLALAPTFVPFTPWTTLEGYLDLLRDVAALGLVESVAPVQLAIRLLLPPGSKLLDLDEVKSLAGPLDPQLLCHPWRNPDARVDALQSEVQALVEAAPDAPRRERFARIWELAHAHCGRASTPLGPAALRAAAAPRMSEPWYCCAEPTGAQLAGPRGQSRFSGSS